MHKQHSRATRGTSPSTNTPLAKNRADRFLYMNDHHHWSITVCMQKPKSLVLNCNPPPLPSFTKEELETTFLNQFSSSGLQHTVPFGTQRNPSTHNFQIPGLSEPDDGWPQKLGLLCSHEEATLYPHNYHRFHPPRQQASSTPYPRTISKTPEHSPSEALSHRECLAVHPSPSYRDNGRVS